VHRATTTLAPPGGGHRRYRSYPLGMPWPRERMLRFKCFIWMLHK
jgi:hypothetical protein